MTTARWGLAVAVLVALGCGAEARADALQLKQVAADAKWVGHIDCDAMRASTVVQKAWDKVLELHKDARAHLDKAHEVLGIDLTEDIHCVTVYGKVVGKENGVALLHAKLDRAKLEGLVAKAQDHKVAEAGAYKIHSWIHNDHGKSKPVSGAIRGDDLVVLAGCVDDVKAALAVLDGKAPAMADDGPLRGRTWPGACLLFRVVGISEAKLPGEPPLAKQTESYRFAIGENDGKVFYRSRAVMTNEEVVGQVKKILEGIHALAMIHVKDDAKGKAMLDAFQLTTEGKNVTVSAEVPAADVWDQIVKHGKIIIERRKAHEAKGK